MTEYASKCMFHIVILNDNNTINNKSYYPTHRELQLT